MKMKCHFKVKRTISLLFFICLSSLLNAQEAGIKTNLSYWATTTPNLGIEFTLNNKNTLEIAGGINLFEFSNHNQFKHWLIQPEFRWWLCEAFNGHFFGAHLHGSQFNVGGWDIPFGRLDIFKDKRYEGYLYGGGISYGYQWITSDRWNIEFNIGLGYAHIDYKEYPCKECGTKLSDGNYNYWGITKVGLSIIYLIK